MAFANRQRLAGVEAETAGTGPRAAGLAVDAPAVEPVPPEMKRRLPTRMAGLKFGPDCPADPSARGGMITSRGDDPLMAMNVISTSNVPGGDT
jgi:hypothetical protein